ncbi:MAG TPA: glycosyltransferase family 39 protein [Gemmatimonadaceae bacterium]|nr:glycosyltransferase family 39 protein [Gemmatimonadaceae bacterium]
MTTPHSASAAEGERRAWLAALAVTALAALVRLLFAARLPLFPDETYYWEWSRRLAGGYFDHPPMIAVLIRAGTGIGGSSPLAVRFFSVLAGAAASLATAGIAWRLAGGAAAIRAAVVLALMPLVASGLVLATPDAPLLAACAAGLYGVVRALQSPLRSRASLLWWSAAGVALGLAFVSKYTSILLPLAITAAVLIRPSLRARLREPGPYVACVLATLMFLPVLQWNAAHDWISFRFQLQHGLGTPRGSAIGRELDLIGGQLGLVSPILFALMAHAVWRTLRRPLDDARFALATVATGCWVFFVYSATRRSVEPNWPAPSYIPGVALLAALATTAGYQRWLRHGVALAALLVGVLYMHALVPVLPLPARRDPLARNAGWASVAARVDEARRRAPGRVWVGAERYQDVGELAYHLPGEPVAFCTCLRGRRNQYELWPGFPQRASSGDALVLALDERRPGEIHEAASALAPYFAGVSRGALAPLLRGGDTVSVRRVWLLEGYRGGWPSRAEP